MAESDWNPSVLTQELVLLTTIRKPQNAVDL